MQKIKVGSDFSGVGAFDQALKRLGVNYETVFACDMDKYARDTFIHNYGEPKYYPMNVYDREIPSESLDIYMTSPPCQAFSLAGKRLGKDDKRGILFFNSHEFIQVNKPRFFIFENVKGLLSDDGGKTFQEWINMLGGKSVNGLPVLFPHDDSVAYHLYWKVLNAKHHGVPQNRERVFLIGIKDDVDNKFQFPKEEHLTKRLKDVLEDDVDDKYFLSEKTINVLLNHQKFNEFKPIENTETESSCITAHCGKFGNANNYLKINSRSEIDNADKIMCIGNTNPSGRGMNGNVFDEQGISPTLSTNKGEGIKIKSATSKGYEEAKEGDSINFSVPSSKTRRGRVGKGVAQTLDTGCNQGIWIADYRADEGLRIRKDDISPCMTSSMQDYNEWNPKAGTRNQPLVGYHDKNLNQGVIQKTTYGKHQQDCFYDSNGIIGTIPAGTHGSTPHLTKTLMPCGTKIRRLTPRECFRLMDFPDTFTWPVSDSQAYKQAGNSIVVNVLYKILKQLPL
jgi:DNA (cytosine-5)-methyltransferase 1